MPPNVTVGMKRKIDDLIDDETSYRSQRQSVLDISIFKLRNPPKKKVEPSLRRNVLLLNTLKHIETELKMEGIKSVHPPFDASFSISGVNSTDFTLDPIPDADSASHLPLLNPPMPKLLDSSESMLAELCPNDGLQDRSIVDLMPCRSVPLHAFDDSRSTSPRPQDNSSNMPTVAIQPGDLLEDIDLAICDFDFLTYSPWKLTPLSVEEVIHSFPAAASNAENFQTMLNTPCSSFCRSDQSLDDLDTIMQVLVDI